MQYGRRRFRVLEPTLALDSVPTYCAPTDVDEVGSKRRLHCRRYTECLTYAASQNWPGFHCHKCGVEEPLTMEEQRRDLEGLTDFLRALRS